MIFLTLKGLRFIFCFLLISFSLWGAGVVYYMLSETLLVPYCIMMIIAGVSLLFLRKNLSKKFRRSIYSAMWVISLGLLLFYFIYPASNERPWMSSWKKIPVATISKDTLTIHNLRNFKYTTETNFDSNYVTRTYDLSQVQSLDLFVSHWDGMEKIAHTMLSFGFCDGQFLTLSCETRKEWGKKDDLLGGIFKQSHFIYIWGTETDLIALRTNYRHEEVYLYRMNISPQEIRPILLSFLESSNRLLTHPEFYNTVTHNCTTAFIPSFQTIYPQLRFHLNILTNGNLDHYIFDKRGLHTRPEESFKALKTRSLIPFDISKNNFEDYSKSIRKHQQT